MVIAKIIKLVMLGITIWLYMNQEMIVERKRIPQPNKIEISVNKMDFVRSIFLTEKYIARILL